MVVIALSIQLASTGKFFSMHVGIGFLSRGNSIERINSYISSGASEIFPSIYSPLENRNQDDDSKCRNTIIWIGESVIRLSSIYESGDSLMLLPVTVLEGGKTNRTVVKRIYDKAIWFLLEMSHRSQIDSGSQHTISTTHPIVRGKRHFLSGRDLRP